MPDVTQQLGFGRGEAFGKPQLAGIVVDWLQCLAGCQILALLQFVVQGFGRLNPFMRRRGLQGIGF